MKKLRKSLSFSTKILLVFGLLISNLSSLSVVFADEVKTEIKIIDNELSIKYLDELADEVENVKINVYENYTYLDETYYVDEVTSLKGKVSSYELSFKEEVSNDMEDSLIDENVTEEITEEDSLNDVATNGDELVATESDELVDEEVATGSDEIEDTEDVVEKEIDLVVESILSDIVFDGTYDVTVEIIDTTNLENQEVIDTQEYSMAVLHDSGLKVSVIDEVTGLEVNLLSDGRYAVSKDSPKVLVVGELLAGGLSPRDQILYNNQEYFAYELMGYGFSSKVDFNGLLYGDYALPVSVELSKYNRETNEYDKIDFSNEQRNANILYGEYEFNTQALNETTLELELDENYQFDGNDKNGFVYVLLNTNKVNTMWDLYSILNKLYENDEYISFVVSNSLYENVLNSYSSETSTVSLEEYLKAMELDKDVLVSISNEGLTITYQLIFAGDANNDKKLTQEDLVDLIDQVVGEKEIDANKSNLYGDDEVNTLDVIYLDQVIKTNNWNVELNSELDKLVDSELQVVETDIISGDKFTVNYIVKLSDLAINGIAGLFTYDKDVLELESVKALEEWIGNSKDGKFLYMGEESLELPEVEEETDDEMVQPDESVEVLEDTEEILNGSQDDELVEEEVITKDYIVVSATFVAKKAGTHTINVENREYFNHDTYYGVEEELLSTTVEVGMSDDNNLSSLVVAGVEIELFEDKLEYEITVDSNVTTADVEAILSNVAANITSIVSPEELVEGENIITVTVTAENGDVKVYTIKVIREEMPKEETTQVYYNNYYDQDDNDDENEVVVTEPENDDEDDVDTDKEDSNLSRIVIIILILLVIAGLIYLIFKDEDEEETKKVNKDVNKLRKEEKVIEIKKEEKVNNKSNNKSNNKNNNSNKNKNYKNNKKER